MTPVVRPLGRRRCGSTAVAFAIVSFAMVRPWGRSPLTLGIPGAGLGMATAGLDGRIEVASESPAKADGEPR